MPPPVRTNAADYHYHVYDYPQSARWKLSKAQPQRGNQMFYSMLRDVQGLFATAQANNVPSPVLTTLGAQIAADGETYDVQALSFGGPAPLGATPQIVITGGIHAREWVATEMAYLLAEYLIMNYSAATVGLSSYQQSIQNIINQRRIHIIPMLNPAGNQYSVMSPDGGARLWRRNRNPMPITGAGWQTAITIPVAGGPQPPFQNVQQNVGVTSYEVPRYRSTRYDTINLPNTATIGADLNRNFPSTAFGHSGGPRYTNGVPGTDSYFGTAAASEVETQNVEAFLGQIGNVTASIDYHSYSKFILYPSELVYAGSVNASYTNLGEVLQRLIMPSLGWSWSYDYKLGPPIDLVKYDATGTVADRIGQLSPSRSFTIELDPAYDDDPPGFELPPGQIMSVFEKNIRGALALLVAANQPTTFTSGIFQRRTISSGERGLLDWNVYGRGNRLPV